MLSLLKNKIKSFAFEEGFHLVGVTKSHPHPSFEAYRAWIEKGYQGDMDYLKRHLAWKENPNHLLKDAKSILMCGLSYKTKYQNPMHAPKGKGLISNYAWGEDYHHILKKKLKNVLKKIKNLDPKIQGKVFCDTSAVLERSYAAAAGLGWVGKNTMVMDKTYGSYFFLGGILLNVDLACDPIQTDHCGTCMKCIEACPTDALEKPYVLNASRCISYLTIEKRGDFSPQEEKDVQSYAFGCDICQRVCPWNTHAKTPDLPFFQPREGTFVPDLLQLQDLSEAGFKDKYKQSPLQRAKYQGFQRNLKVLAHKAASLVS